MQGFGVSGPDAGNRILVARTMALCECGVRWARRAVASNVGVLVVAFSGAGVVAVGVEVEWDTWASAVNGANATGSEVISRT
jgi:hypothetical protein